MDETNMVVPDLEEEPNPTQTQPMDEGHEPPQAQPKPAFTIVVHSWATPIAGLVMLAIGLLGGYFGRSLVSPQASPTAAAVQPTITSGTSVSASPQPQSADPDELMAYVVSQTRHFKGDSDAPVTIIEFSDFQ